LTLLLTTDIYALLTLKLLCLPDWVRPVQRVAAADPHSSSSCDHLPMLPAVYCHTLLLEYLYRLAGITEQAPGYCQAGATFVVYARPGYITRPHHPPCHQNFHCEADRLSCTGHGAQIISCYLASYAYARCDSLRALGTAVPDSSERWPILTGSLSVIYFLLVAFYAMGLIIQGPEGHAQGAHKSRKKDRRV
jgi:hypothetical protein